MSGSSQSPAMNQFGAFFFGVICVIFGIFYLIDTNQKYSEYMNSRDKQTVEAEVKKVSTRHVKHYSSKHGTRTETKYECLYEYKINGNTMYHTESYSRPREVGSKTTFHVFLNKYGRYQVGTITSSTDKTTCNVIGFVAIFIGLFSFGYGLCIKIPVEPPSNSVPSYLADIYNNNDNSNGYNNGNSYNNSNGYNNGNSYNNSNGYNNGNSYNNSNGYNNGNSYNNSNGYNNGNSYNNSNAHNNGNGYNNANSYNNGNANNNGNGYSNSNSYNDYYNEDNYKN